MTTREERAHEIQAQIREILLRDWDPIGVRDEARARDEYDGYIGGVYRLLASGAAPQSVAEHLAHVEAEQTGLGVSADKLMDVATKLCALDVKLRIAGGAFLQALEAAGRPQGGEDWGGPVARRWFC